MKTFYSLLAGAVLLAAASQPVKAQSNGNSGNPCTYMICTPQCIVIFGDCSHGNTNPEVEMTSAVVRQMSEVKEKQTLAYEYQPDQSIWGTVWKKLLG